MTTLASSLLTLCLVHLIGLMSPGPDFALVTQYTARYGRITGLIIAVGLAVGIGVHTLLSLFGISLFIQHSPQLFSIVQLLGGSYLLWLAYKSLSGLIKTRTMANTSCEQNPTHLTIEATTLSMPKAFFTGVMTNLFNPKALVFFVSLFTSLLPGHMSLGLKGMIWFLMVSLAFLWFGLVAFSLSFAKMERHLKKYSPVIDAICGVLFLFVGGTILSQLFLNHSI
ncbi:MULTISPECIES: LysE family translocator [unclassified Vibrio]|uniref:LysE family translocator n=1 Tax=Vibrio sp. HB236076 TaxID=3232307 RepID=A0AB39HG01_9VIBR|nr:LysE family translocator [Vibrio sp. HB161653]MDP5255814.1 LysE family translocator [Vibrio sp. HB161653]